MDLGLRGKRVLVTGGASGLGAALVRVLVEEGANVCLNYRSRQAEAEELVAELNESRHGRGVSRSQSIGCERDCENGELTADVAGQVCAVQADLADMDQVRQLFAQARDQLGGLDALVNNAGLWLTTGITDVTEELWDRTMNVNLKTPMLLTQLFVQHCHEHDQAGAVLSVTSQAAFRGSSTGHMPYATAKGGLVSMTRSLVQELRGSKIRFNTLAIGTMESPMIAEALERNREFYEARIPVGYVATADQVASVAAFLISERADYISGACIDVSGGQLLH